MKNECKIEKRRFYRHPISVPLNLSTAKTKRTAQSRSLDVSLGGLSFLWPQKLPKGSSVKISIPVKNKLFGIKSRVAYAVEESGTGKFRTGVCFMDHSDAFMARLAEELIEILQYRNELSQELGREIPEEEAASLWIKKRASRFPTVT